MAEESSDTVRDTMVEEWDKAVEEEEEVETEEEEAVEAEDSDEEGEEEEVAREEEEAVEGDEEVAAEGDEEVEIKEPRGGKVPPLEHWSQEDKQQFSELPERAQEFLVRRDKQFQAYWTRKLQDVADIKRALEPARAEMEQFGVSEGDAVRRLVGAHKMLQNNPNEGIRYIAETYGIDLGNLDAPRSEDSAVMREVASIRQQLAESERQRYQRNVMEWDVKIEEFKKDHEFYSALEPDMMRIADVYAHRGEPIPSLDTLYEQAAWANPTVRARLLSKDEEKRLAEQKARARKAKKAASTKVHSTSMASEKKPEKTPSLHQALSENFDKLKRTAS